MSNVTDYYKFATLSTASYVRMGGLSLDGATFAQRAADAELNGGRLPLVQGQFFFDPANAFGAPVWNVLSYYGGDIPTSVDPIAAADRSGFGATLFERDGEKVLAMRGTEPFQDGLVDLLSADMGQIGIFGLALTQVVSMANYVARLRAPFGVAVPQLKVEATTTQPSLSQRYLVAEGSSLSAPVYLVFSDTVSATGLDKIRSGDVVKVTGIASAGILQ